VGKICFVKSSNYCKFAVVMERYIRQAFEAKEALLALSDSDITAILNDTAAVLDSSQAMVLSANADDLQRMSLSDPKYDRLQLTEERLAAMSSDMRQVAQLPSPLGSADEPYGRVISVTERPSGLTIRKVAVPFGVIGVVYEARPNVTFDVFSLCLKSGNVCLLKGGSDAYSTNCTLVSIIQGVLRRYGLPESVCTLMPAGREATAALLAAVGYVDLVIPRGSAALINYVRAHARVPVIETGAGVCHTYFDAAGNREYARALVHNAKTRRVSVCNALDCLVVHASRLAELPYICAPLAAHKVVIYADPAAYAALSGEYPASLLQPATDDSYGTEFLDYKMSIKTVSSLDEALGHIALYGSKHSECIVSDSKPTVKAFERRVDAACVYANVSTAFTDGAQFGFGAEIGISTQKLHARGPMALPELTTYKYIIEGEGVVRG
jgi:glutamate-5-semialdehyde dehydrogenase